VGKVSEFPSTPFWDFSLSVYGGAGVAPACLALQERYGADVNLLLFGAWFGAAGFGRLTAQEVADLWRRIGPWHRDAVRHLRALRVALREGFEPVPDDLVQLVRRRIQRVELDAEHIEQIVLAAWVGDRAPNDAAPGMRLGDAAANMVAYVRFLTDAPAADDRTHLATILDACASWLGTDSTIVGNELDL
jgi:uncharacterized protein (TIGR02444 family)